MRLPKVILRIEDKYGNFITQSKRGKYSASVLMLAKDVAMKHNNARVLTMYVSYAECQLNCDYSNEKFALRWD